jgi:hypothetical protein
MAFAACLCDDAYSVLLLPIHGFIKSAHTFPNQKFAIFRKYNKIIYLRKVFLVCAALSIPDLTRPRRDGAEIAKKGHLRAKTI